VRLIIADAHLIPGDGQPLREGVTIAVENTIVTDVIPRRYPYYDRADLIIDARGHFVAPGLIDHHAHGMAVGPLMGTAEPPLSAARVRYNRGRLLHEGVTRVVNVDGFILPHEVGEPDPAIPIDVALTTLHVPGFKEWASQLSLGGLTRPHREASLETMLAAGAVAVGEAGIGIDDHWVIYTILPRLLDDVRDGQGRGEGHWAVTPEAAAAVLRAAPDCRRVAEALHEHHLAEISVERCLHLVERARDTQRLAQGALWAAARAARDASVPLIAHHTPATTRMLREIAAETGVPMIASHSNFRASSPEDAVSRAQSLRERGVRIDIMTGDLFGLREFTRDPRITVAMIASGVVDLISTDYVGGFWDSMLRTLRCAVDEGAIDLATGFRLVAWNAVEVLPRLGKDSGRIVPGGRADLVILDRDGFDRVLGVIVQGRVAVGRLQW
jgi:imidazolonepropionase-like amidohydrolase